MNRTVYCYVFDLIILSDLIETVDIIEIDSVDIFMRISLMISDHNNRTWSSEIIDYNFENVDGKIFYRKVSNDHWAILDLKDPVTCLLADHDNEN